MLHKTDGTSIDVILLTSFVEGLRMILFGKELLHIDSKSLCFLMRVFS